MKLDHDRSPVVLAGAWNLAIFTPAWVGKHLFPNEPTFTLQVAVGPAFALKFVGQSVVLTAESGSLKIAPQGASPAHWEATEQLALRILGLLPQTPMVGLGINFGFDVFEGCAGLERMTTLESQVQFTEQHHAILTNYQANAAFSHAGRVLNLLVGRSTGEPMKVDINFHHAVTAAGAATGLLDGAVRPALESALHILRSVYNLELADE